MAWILFFIALLGCLGLGTKVVFMRRGVAEIIMSLREILPSDSNALITLSAGDRSLKKLASELNMSLKELKRLRRKYANGDREIKEAVTNISHDLRTPLTAIFGYLELLRDEPKTPAAERYVKNIENRAEAMKALTEELFRYSVILSASENMALEPVDISAVLEESVAGLYGALKERGIEPEISLPKAAPVKNLNREALQRVYGNILSNALKYSDGDLSVTLDREGRAVFRNSAEKLRGIDVEKLFDRFFSVEAAENSTGLGLAISKALCEHMGGSISAWYSDGKLSIEVGF